MAIAPFSREQIEAFIAAIEADPNLRAHVERAILHDRLLEMPDRLDHFIEATDRRFATLEAAIADSNLNQARLVSSQESLEAQMARLVSSQESLEAQMARLVSSQESLEAQMAELTQKVEALTEAQNRTQISLDRLIGVVERHEISIGFLMGGYFETKWRENATSYLGSQGFRKVRYLLKNALADLLDDADDAAHDDILLVDAVHSAIRKSTGENVYVVSEISSRIHREDVERASRRAHLLQEVLKTECVSVVAGASIDDFAQAVATQHDVIVITPSEWQQSAA